MKKEKGGMKRRRAEDREWRGEDKITEKGEEESLIIIIRRRRRRSGYDRKE